MMQGNIIRLSVTPIDSEHDVADFPSQRGNAVHRLPAHKSPQSYAVVAAFGPPAPADSMTEHENSEVHFIGVALIIRPDLSLYRNKTAPFRRKVRRCPEDAGKSAHGFHPDARSCARSPAEIEKTPRRRKNGCRQAVPSPLLKGKTLFVSSPVITSFSLLRLRSSRSLRRLRFIRDRRFAGRQIL